MTRILIVGNSQAAILKAALDAAREQVSPELDFGFCVAPGGDGPYVEVVDGLLRFNYIRPKVIPYYVPSDVEHHPIAGYDVLVVSALGYMDGGFAYENPIIRQGSLWAYGATQTDRLLSQACYAAVARSILDSQPGIRFASTLRDHFRGQILIQSFPSLSETIVDNPDWRLRKTANDPAGFYGFLGSVRDAYLSELADQIDADLLPQPPSSLTEEGFTRKGLMRPDAIHGAAAYGRLVLHQIMERIRAP